MKLILSTPLREKNLEFEVKDCLLCKHCSEVHHAKVSEEYVVIAYRIYCSIWNKWLEHTNINWGFLNYCEEYEEDPTKLDDFWEWLSFKLGGD